MDSEQIRCLQSVKDKKNVFLTGSAGTGKSFTITRVMNYARQEQKKVACTAMTGCAAILLHPKATTLHSFAGIGLGKETVERLYMKIMKNKKARERWKTTDLLIIDEVSMLGPKLFVKLERLARMLRNNEHIFGGMQVLLSGDFFQLPPVEETEFLFESPLFRSCIQETIVLRTVYRQKDDHSWFRLLQNIRIGELSGEDLCLLRERMRLSENIDPQEMTKLFSVNRKVDELNNYYLKILDQPVRTFFYQVENPSKASASEIQCMMQQMSIPETIQLCLGAQVMLTYNLDIDKKLVNGSQGKVVGFSEGGFPMVRFRGSIVEMKAVEFSKTKEDSDEILFTISQLPLRLSWALSIHKVQGHSLDSAFMDLGMDIFECGQIYVALSRIKTLNGVYLSDFCPEKIKVNPKVLEFYQSISIKC